MCFRLKTERKYKLKKIRSLLNHLFWEKKNPSQRKKHKKDKNMLSISSENNSTRQLLIFLFQHERNGCSNCNFLQDLFHRPADLLGLWGRGEQSKSSRSSFIQTLQQRLCSKCPRFWLVRKGVILGVARRAVIKDGVLSTESGEEEPKQKLANKTQRARREKQRSNSMWRPRDIWYHLWCEECGEIAGLLRTVLFGYCEAKNCRGESLCVFCN